MKLGTWLLALVEPMLAKIFVSLGFSIVSIVGFEAAIGQVRSILESNVNALPGDMLQIFLFAGGGQAFGIILGAVTTKLLLWKVTQATKILGSNNG